MKKFLVTVLSVALLLSTTACGTNSELEELKQENEQLKAQLEESSESTEKPTENQQKNRLKNQKKRPKNKKHQIPKPIPTPLTSLPPEIMKYRLMYSPVNMTL